MNLPERQTAPPLAEVVSVTFRFWVHRFEAMLCGSDAVCFTPRFDFRDARGLSARAEVYADLATEIEPAASTSQPPSALVVGIA